MRPSQTILVLEDLRNSFRGPLFRKGIELSSYDRATVLDVYQQWLALMVDLGYLTHDCLLRDAQRIFQDMVRSDVLDLNGAFAELLQLVRCQTNRGFKALCKRISCHLYNILKDDMSKTLKGDIYAAKRLMQAFAYTGRLSLHDIDLTQQCLEGYMAVEESILDDYPEPLLQELNSYVRSWMKPFDSSNFKFHHGPGGVAGLGRTSLHAKYKHLDYDQMLTYSFGDPWWASDDANGELRRCSKTIFVPKSYKTFRTISMEPATLQYCQQGVWGEIRRITGESKFLRSHIGFDDQTRNASLAKVGSIERSYATLDLSSASDSVGYTLIKRLFRGTKLLRFIVTTRSKETILPDGQQILLKKFAPMGSSLCFPIETILFASICQHVTRVFGVPGDYSVYGDDIIVPTQCAGYAIQVLEELGFRVNLEKSFYQPDCWFRESCGAEYCNGYDVTPMRISRKYDSRDDVERGTALVSAANEAYRRGFRVLRHFFIRKFRIAGWIPYFSTNQLLGDSYTNYHAKERWNPALQRLEILVSCEGAQRKKKQSLSEEIRYRHWLEVTANRRNGSLANSLMPGFQFKRFSQTIESLMVEGFVSYVGLTSKVVKERWMPKPYDPSDQRKIELHLSAREIRPIVLRGTVGGKPVSRKLS